MLAHVAGMPVEEALAGLAPIGATAFAAVVVHVRHHVHRLRRGRRGYAP